MNQFLNQPQKGERRPSAHESLGNQAGSLGFPLLLGIAPFVTGLVFVVAFFAELAGRMP